MSEFTPTLAPPGVLAGLEGQRVIVTAGAGGIGLSTARLLRAQGCRVALRDVSYEDMETRYLEMVSLRRMVTAEDVAGSIAFLLSAAGRNLSAMSFNVDGNEETL